MKIFKVGPSSISDFNMEITPSFGSIRLVIHLKERMAEIGLTQMKLAELSGVRQATISQLSRGHIDRLHIPSLEKIAQAMNIKDISQLITFVNED